MCDFQWPHLTRIFLLEILCTRCYFTLMDKAILEFLDRITDLVTAGIQVQVCLTPKAGGFSLCLTP